MSDKPKRKGNYKPAPKGNKRALGNKGGGRPTKLTTEAARIAEAGYKAGLTDVQVAAVLGVDESTIHGWKKIKPEFFQVPNWKDQADTLVERSLFQRALGYETPDTHFSAFEGIVTATPTTKHVPADPASIQFWLKNRKPEWRADREDGNQQLVNLNIVFLPDPAKGIKQARVNGIADGIGKQSVLESESGNLGGAADTQSSANQASQVKPEGEKRMLW